MPFSCIYGKGDEWAPGHLPLSYSSGSGAHTVKFNCPPCPLGTAGQSTLKGCPFIHVGFSRDKYGRGLISLWILSFCFAKLCKTILLNQAILKYSAHTPWISEKAETRQTDRHTHTHAHACDINKCSVTSPRNTCLSFLPPICLCSSLLQIWFLICYWYD